MAALHAVKFKGKGKLEGKGQANTQDNGILKKDTMKVQSVIFFNKIFSPNKTK